LAKGTCRNALSMLWLRWSSRCSEPEPSGY